MNIPKILIPVEQSSGDYKAFEFSQAQITWPEIRNLWAIHSVKLPLCFAPPETKLEIFFYYACQEYGAPASLGSVYNPGWTELFLSEVNHDCLIVADTLLPYITTNRLFTKAFDHIKLLICIGKPDLPIEQQLQAQYPKLTCEALPHPMGMLCV